VNENAKFVSIAEIIKLHEKSLVVPEGLGRNFLSRFKPFDLLEGEDSQQINELFKFSQQQDNDAFQSSLRAIYAISKIAGLYIQ